jgi:hypothetical protein
MHLTRPRADAPSLLPALLETICGKCSRRRVAWVGVHGQRQQPACLKIAFLWLGVEAERICAYDCCKPFAAWQSLVSLSRVADHAVSLPTTPRTWRLRLVYGWNATPSTSVRPVVDATDKRAIIARAYEALPWVDTMASFRRSQKPLEIGRFGTRSLSR